MALLLKEGDIMLFKIDGNGITKVGFIEFKRMNPQPRPNDYCPISDVVLLRTDNKTILVIVEPKGRFYLCDIALP